MLAVHGEFYYISAKACSGSSTVFSATFKENSEAFFFLPLAPTVSWTIDAS